MNSTGISQFNQARIEWAIRLRYSPMPKLDMELLATELNAFRIGELRTVGKTWEVMMERDGELAINSEKRKSDSACLEWQISSDGSPDGDKHAAALQYFYDNLSATKALDQDATGSVDELVFQTLSAVDYYYSAHEILLRIDNPAAKEITAEFRHTPLWFFEARRGYLGYLKHIFDMYGQPCIAGEWLTAVNTGWMRQLTMPYCAKWMSIRDWLLFGERYGSGFLEAITDATKDSQEWNDAQTVLNILANDGLVLHNKGVELKFLEQASRNELPFQPIVELIDRLYAKCYRGVDLATGSRGEGGRGQMGGARNAVGASVQKEESGILLVRDAKWITGVFNDRIDRPILRYLFNEEPRAWFALLPPLDDTSSEDLQSLQTLVPMGLRVALKEVYKRFRWSVPDEGDACLQPAMQPGAGEPEDRGNGAQTLSPTPRPTASPILAEETPEDDGQTQSAKTTDQTPIAPGADPARNPGLAAPAGANYAETSSRQLPDTQVDAGAFWSRAGLAPRGADGQTLPMPSLGYAVPNAAAPRPSTPDPALLDRHANLVARGLGNSRAAQALQREITRRRLEQDASRLETQNPKPETLSNAGFNLDEPRDSHGRWTTDGGGSETNHPSQTNMLAPEAARPVGQKSAQSPLRLTDAEVNTDSDDDDLGDIPLTYGEAHAMLRRSQSAASAHLYDKSGAEMQGAAAVGRAVAEMNPVVGAVDGTYQAATGKDAIDSNKQLTPGQRLTSGGEAVIAVAPFILRGAKLVKVVGEVEEAVDVSKGLAQGWSALVKAEEFTLKENQAISGLIKDGKVLAIGDPWLGHDDLARKFGIELVNGKLPKGVEGFLAQKIGGKIGVIGAGINGTGQGFPISDAGKKVVEAFLK